MSRGRFALLMVAIAIVVAGGAFAAGLQLLDDGKPDPPPQAPTASANTTTTAPASATAVPTTVPPGVLATPAWVTVVASEGSEAEALDVAEAVGAKGYPTGVLHSDDYSSLKPGLWVAFAGPYPDKRAAEAAIEALATDGVGGAYVRCAGSREECKQDD